ncbi:WD40-repeat-containing domain protein [Chiua virens]|nr:WD40-repeat-containing domain protein [Chiua virens]
MVQSYLRHGPTQAFGLICSVSSNSLYDGKHAYVPALEDVLVWDMKKGHMLAMWHETGHRAEVTCMQRSPQPNLFAVGYADGSVRLWDSVLGSVRATFNGHQKAVTALAFDSQGVRLASGSQDTNLIVWDIVAEVGLYRLGGHRDQVTAIRFLPSSELPPTSSGTSNGFLLSTSKDTLLKLWDLSTQHCMQTVVAHRSEVWSMDLSSRHNLIFTGSGEGDLKAWKIDYVALAVGLQTTESGEMSKMVQPIAALPLSSHHRVSQVLFHDSQPYVAIQSHDRSIEIFRIRTEDEARKKQARRRKRAKEKGKKSKPEEEPFDKADYDEADAAEIGLVDLFTPYLVIRASGKVRSFDFGTKGVNGQKTSVQILLALASNALEVYDIPPPSNSKDQPPESSRVYSLDIPGHRTDVRSLCLSSDDQILASASNGTLKLWNSPSCRATDTLLAVGTKSGDILIYDLASSALVDTVKAHSSTVWSIHLRPDERVLVSGSADKEVKFWEFEHDAAAEDEDQPKKSLSLVHARTLKMSDDVLSVRYSPNGKLLAVSLLDSTVKIFFQDTLKFFLSLYGHKLPVLAMDISDDSKLIVTCSADKNVKIWGLDFGDCHKSIFAHEDSVTHVLFEKKSHYFWTVGKDKMLKYWDGDKFENIQKLDGHHNEIWALAVSHHGNFVVTGSHDKSIRIWEKLDEPLFLEEERERELEQLYENDLAETLNKPNGTIGQGENADGGSSAEVAAVTKQTMETLMAGERIMEALDLADNERAALRDFEEQKARASTLEAAGLQPPPRNPILAALDLDPDAYVLRIVEKIPRTALYDALLSWNIALVSYITFFLLKTHHHQIVTNRIMRTTLIPMRIHLRDALRREKDTVGYNLAALQYIRRKSEAERTALFFEKEHFDESQVRQMISEGKKRKRGYVPDKFDVSGSSVATLSRAPTSS